MRQNTYVNFENVIFIRNGEEWWRLRQSSQKVMTRIPCVRAHLPGTDKVSKNSKMYTFISEYVTFPCHY